MQARYNPPGRLADLRMLALVVGLSGISAGLYARGNGVEQIIMRLGLSIMTAGLLVLAAIPLAVDRSGR